MKRILGGKFALAVSVFLIIAFGAFLGVTAVAAQEAEDIAPDQAYDIITLLQGQSATLSVSQSAPYGFHSVFVTSIGNPTIGATLTGVADKMTMGWWTVMLIGYRSRTLVDFSFGVVPWGGVKASIDLTEDAGFGLVLSTVFLSVMPESGQTTYSLSIGQ
jgi:hypothetical protein